MSTDVAGTDRNSARTGSDRMDHAGAGAPPGRSTTRRWPWWAAGGVLLLGGLLTAAGGWLRWWGPYRLENLASRENDDANPLHMGWTFHVHPGSGELVASGQLLVALALLILLFLPWRRATARVLAWPALVSGAIGIALAPVMWVSWWAQGRPSAEFPGWSPDVPQQVLDGLALIGYLWFLGIGPVLLVCAVASVHGAGSSSRRWRRTVPAFALLVLTAPLIEYFTAFLLFLSDSHDDPVGTHVVSGLAAAVAGVLLLRAGASAGGVPPDAVAATRATPPRTLRWWRAAGAMAVVAGVLAGVGAWLTPRGGVLATEEPSTASVVVGVLSSAALATVYVLAALGPMRGSRRAAAVVLAVVAIADVVIGLIVASPTGFETLDASLGTAAYSLATVSGVWGLGFGLLLLAFVLAWENAVTAPTRRGSVLLVALSSIAPITAQVVLPSFVMDAPALQRSAWALALVLVGLTWWMAARPRPVPPAAA